MKAGILIVSAVTCAIGLATSAQAGNLLTNGGFETGTYAGWSANVQPGSAGTLTVVPNDGGISPLSGFSYQLNPAGGNFFSITDQSSPGSYSLTQGFTLAKATKVTITFDMFANNQAAETINNGRDYTGDPNQNAVVDLLWGSADPFTNAAGDIVATLYGPGSDDLTSNPNPWTSYSTTLFLAAGNYLIRFAETDNQNFFQQGVDNVSVTAGVPEAATWALMLGGFGMVGSTLRRSRTANALA
jgi:hypothetical protein